MSDNETQVSAAAMDVGNGSFSDPSAIPGQCTRSRAFLPLFVTALFFSRLAHFLEHMLFLGTKKYPKEDAYDNFLGNHGGSFNAFTASENTNFYFSIPPPHLFGTHIH